MIRTGLALLALFAVCHANLYCHECTWPDDGDKCRDGIVEYEEPNKCSADATDCAVTTHKEGDEVKEITRACIGGGSKVNAGCDKKDGKEACTTICRNTEGCNAPTPTSPPTTPTTTSTTAGASDVTVSRLVILAAGALTAMMCLKL